MIKIELSLSPSKVAGLLSTLESAQKDGFKLPLRDPIHSIYGGAHLFKADIAAKLRGVALSTLEKYAPDTSTLSHAVNKKLSEKVYDRVREKLAREPVEDLRIDFEDGFGIRSDEEEDEVASQAALETALGVEKRSLPPFIGIRVKSLSGELRGRSIRTLDLYLSTLLSATNGKLPDNFVVTLPKINCKDEVSTLVSALEQIEKAKGVEPGKIKIELMIETPCALIDDNGVIAPLHLVRASRGRCVAVHFGPYDYCASNGIIAPAQSLAHPVCEFARQLLRSSLAGTGIRISDGPTPLIPIGQFREKEGAPLTEEQEKINKAHVYTAWRTAFQHICSALNSGFYQGWDLHPAQLPIRYAASYAFFLEGYEHMIERLKGFIEKAARQNLTHGVFDDAATAQGILNYFSLALSCGAITEGEALSTGLTLDELRSRSFLKILKARKILEG